MKKILIISIIIINSIYLHSQHVDGGFTYSFYIASTMQKKRLNVDVAYVANINLKTDSITKYLPIVKLKPSKEHHFFNTNYGKIENINFLAIFIDGKKYWIYLGDTYDEFHRFYISIDTSELDKLSNIDTTTVHNDYYLYHGDEYKGKRYQNNNVSKHTVSAYLNQVSQDTWIDNERENNESFSNGYFPHEIKYGGIFSKEGYNNNFNASYHIAGLLLDTKEGQQTIVSTGLSYNRQFKNNYSSLFLYYGSIHWVGINIGLKVEPLLNFNNFKFEYINIEASAGWKLNLAVFVGLPTSINLNSTHWGFKVGYSLPYPWILKRKKPD